jgi:hypothetical protein
VYLELAIVNVNHKLLCRVLPEIVIVTHLKERIGSTHDSGARGLGFDLIQTKDGIFNRKTLISFLSDNRLKNDYIHL